MTITFVGHGYVGLVTATVFADFGNKVYVIGHTKEKIDNPYLRAGVVRAGQKKCRCKKADFYP